ncbi:MAG: nicotinamide mononucleotide transporter, partial [Bacteroidales bacterium]|nr:nicotinamide mononucleotide transporter [Bacteroidales bacterium]
MALLKINDFWNWLELIATIVGMIFVILEVKQKMGMWCANMLSSSMIVAISYHQMLWGTMALNIYYVVMSFVGIYQLNKDKSQTSSDIVVRPITKKVVLTSIIVFLFSSIVLVFLLKLLNDPQPILDALVMPASFIATYWLT